MLESQLEGKAVAEAKRRGILTYKFSSPSNRGVPDRIFIWRGKVFFIEFKAPGKTPTALQEREHDRINRQGVPVFIADDLPTVLNIFTVATQT